MTTKSTATGARSPQGVRASRPCEWCASFSSTSEKPRNFLSFILSIKQTGETPTMSIHAVDPLGDPGTTVMEDTRVSTAAPWVVVIHDDPVNTIEYVILTIQRLFGYARAKAEHHTMEVHHTGRSIVWNGAREKAELYVHQLHAAQLQASLERAGE